MTTLGFWALAVRIVYNPSTRAVKVVRAPVPKVHHGNPTVIVEDREPIGSDDLDLKIVCKTV
jgi:hypothetical protein